MYPKTNAKQQEQNKNSILNSTGNEGGDFMKKDIVNQIYDKMYPSIPIHYRSTVHRDLSRCSICTLEQIYQRI